MRDQVNSEKTTPILPITVYRSLMTDSPSFLTFLIITWMLAMISLPIMKWIWGDGIVPFGLSLGVFLQATAVFFILRERWGWQKTVGTAVLIAALTLFVEWLGSTTGFPFGGYSYTDLMQPQIAHVPVLIPFAWFMMLPAAWAVAHLIQKQLSAKWATNRWLYPLLAGLALTAWDLFLDPQMVAWGLWAWDDPGGYFGIPWSNYAGWLGTAVLLTALIQPKKLPILPLLIIYTITWFLETFGLLFFWGLAGPALVGGVVMGIFVWLGWRSVFSKQYSVIGIQ
ncbi:carotenoid biosynthesis protein [Candidatus Leptofilum sp.]|uniref:carotenoid biosynthesis protein n=1 Tax=Candidatus Leptofilum sp. TaxID=3241576 RepID=UPI003B5A5E89